MEIYMTEDEQVEQIKKLWNQYGNLFILVIAAIGLCLMTWGWWNSRIANQHILASATYDAMIVAHQTNDKAGVAANANTLIAEFPRTVYAQFAKLQLAQQAVSEQKLDEAIKQLIWVTENTDKESVDSLAKIRLARIYTAQNKFADALNILDKIKGKIYTPLIAELKGDVYVLQNKKQNAADAYREALLTLNNNKQHRMIIEMKLDNLGLSQSVKG